MPRYAITEKAGPFVAARRNTGVGTVLDLTELQAEHELRLGTLVLVREVSEAAPERPVVPEPKPLLEPVDVAIDRRRRSSRPPQPSAPSDT